MRKLFTILAAVFLTASVFAQVPEKMSYQAVIRNSSDALVTNTQIGMEINIRQGSPTGTVVYTETQTPTTNANGLVSTEIGGETGFDIINWANGPYFIETKTAVVPPLTTYTITGTSQLLSVPYALYAKTADNGFSGDYNDLSNTPTIPTVPTNVSSFTNDANYLTSFTEVDGSITNEIQALSISNDTVYLSNGGFVKLPAADGSETKVTAGTNVTVTGSGTTASPYVVNAVISMTQTQRDALTATEGMIVYNSTSHKPNYFNGTEWMNYDGTSATTLAIGASYQGGIIAYILQLGDPGYDANVPHGIIAAPSNQSTSSEWGCYGTSISGADGTALGTGYQNTLDIVNGCSTLGTAAKLCNDLVLGGYSDWYLPSIDELQKLYLNRVAVGGFASAVYWSSTENTATTAFNFVFNHGFSGTSGKGTADYVRAVRAF